MKPPSGKQVSLGMKPFRRAFGLNFTSLTWCGGFLLLALMGSHWVSVDSDLVLHILYGRAVIADGLFSSDPLLAWSTEAPVLQEWLFEVLVAWLDDQLGLLGPLLVFAVLMGMLLAGLFRRMRRQGVCLWVALTYAILVLVALRIHLIIRPHMVSWLAVAVLFVLLDDWQQGRRGFPPTLLAAGALMLFWTNTHGGFLIGLALASVFAFHQAYRALAARDSTGLLQAVALVITLTAVSLINPWGWQLHFHLVAFLSNDLLMSSTTDFLPPIFQNGSLFVLLATSLAVTIPMLLAWRQVLLRDWILLAGLLYAAATSARNIPFFGLVMLPIAAGYLQGILQHSRRRFATAVLASSERLAYDEAGKTGVGWPIIMAVSVSGLLLASSDGVDLESVNVPVAALDWVDGQPDLHTRPVFADYMYAGYLLFATPVERAYLHALNANYPPWRLQNYFSIEDGETGWQAYLEGYDWAFVREDSDFDRNFLASACWQPLYSDDQAAIFRKSCDGQ